MALVPQTFPKTPSPAVASYAYTDIAEGTGVVNYYGASTSGSFLLTQSTPYSNNVTVSGAASTSATYVLILSNSYDVEFNLPQDIKGVAYINLTVGVYNPGTILAKQYSDLYIRKWDGAIETEIASASGAYFQTNAAQGSKPTLTKIEIANNAHFRKGDVLRLTIKQYGIGDGVNPLIFGYGQDPKDRNDGDTAKIINDDDATVLNAYVPFRLKV